MNEDMTYILEKEEVLKVISSLKKDGRNFVTFTLIFDK